MLCYVNVAMVTIHKLMYSSKSNLEMSVIQSGNTAVGYIADSWLQCVKI